MSLTPGEIAYEEEHASDNAQPSVIAAITISLFAACAAVSLRLVARFLNRLELRSDDYLVVVALVLDLVLLALNIYGLHLGEGRHIIFVKDPVAFAKSTIAAEVVYASALVPVKLSLIFLYRRIFPTKWLLVALWAVGVLVVSFGIAAFFLAIFNCVPVEGLWNTTIHARCINFNAWIITHGSQNVVTDVVLLSLPIPLVWKLKMPVIRKVQVSFLFILGGFASIASVVRLTYLSKMSMTDASWTNVRGSFWSVIELSFGIVCACAPTLGPLITWLRHPKMSWDQEHTSGSLLFRPRRLRDSAKRRSNIHMEYRTLGTDAHSSGPFPERSSYNFWERSLGDRSQSKRASSPAMECAKIKTMASSDHVMNRDQSKETRANFNNIKVTTDIEQEEGDGENGVRG